MTCDPGYERCDDYEAALSELRARLAEVETQRDNWIATAELHYKEEQALEKRLASISRDYEELRKEIDGGSESMTHVDAVDAVKTYRELLHALELQIKTWQREAEMYEEYGKRFQIAVTALKKHGVHVAEKWCWCKPDVIDYRHFPMRDYSE